MIFLTNVGRWQIEYFGFQKIAEVWQRPARLGVGKIDTIENLD